MTDVAARGEDSCDVVVERAGPTVVVRLNRPQHGNSVHGTLFRDLINAVEAADFDSDVRAIVTTGAGKAYCVGADRSVFTDLAAEGRIDLTKVGFQGPVGGDWGSPRMSLEQTGGDTVGVGRWIRRFLDVGTPTIAAINGGTAGGGLALSLLHDVRIASRTARFGTSFLSLGVSPEMGLSWTLPRIVGVDVAFDLMTRIRPIDADEAKEIGLVSSVVEPDELLEAALARAADFAHLPPVAVRMAKRLLLQSTESTLEVQLEREWHNQVRLLGLSETGQTIREFMGPAVPPQ